MKSQVTLLNAEDIDESSTLGVRQILHRMLQDGSGQDYFVWQPQPGSRNLPLFVTVHDIARNAMAQAQAFAGVCERYGAILIAPHFATDRYPNYQRLGRSRLARDRGRRADEALGAILEDVARLTGTSTQRIHLFGYGAGARFALRYAMAYPERVAGVVIASAEAYTFPDPEKGFPRGIAPGHKRNDLNFRPEQFLRVPMTVLQAVPLDDAEGAPRPVRAVRSSRVTARDKSRKWVTAMTEAASGCQLRSLVSYREFTDSMDSFDSLVQRGGLPEQVFTALLGPAPGLPAVFTAVPARDHGQGMGKGRDDWQLFRDTADDGYAADNRLSTRLRRLALPGIMMLALLAFLVPLIIWAHYRATNVVSREAVVRSHIADVGARLNGVVRTIDVDAGDRIRAGQVVARLEDRHFQARLNQARSQLEKSRRELEVERLAIANERQRLSSSLREVSAELSAARAGVLAAESRVEEAQRQVELQKSLAARGLVPAERARTAENELRTAQALAAEARAQSSAAGAGEDLARVESSGIVVRDKRVSVLESEIATYQAEVALAEANLEGTIIRAPDDGAVVRRIVQPGGSVTVGQPVISLWVGGQIWVEAWIDEDDLADVAVGSAATVSFKSHPDREYSGVVESIGVSTDMELPDSVVPQRRQDRMRNSPVISVRIRLDKPAEDLFPGLSAVVGIRKRSG